MPSFGFSQVRVDTRGPDAQEARTHTKARQTIVRATHASPLPLRIMLHLLEHNHQGIFDEPDAIRLQGRLGGPLHHFAVECEIRVVEVVALEQAPLVIVADGLPAVSAEPGENAEFLLSHARR